MGSSGSSVFKCGTAGFSRSNGSFRPLFALKNGRTQETPRRDRANTGIGLATDRTGVRFPGVQDPALPAPAALSERVRRPTPAVDWRRSQARASDLALDQPDEP